MTVLRQFLRVNSWRKISGAAIAAIILMLMRENAVAAVPSVQLFNNTQYSVDVLSAGVGRLLDTLPPASRKIFAYRTGIIIRNTDGRVLHYHFVRVPREYGRGGFLSLTYNAQLNPDLTISLLPPLANPPALGPVKQPPGFPLRPD